MAIHLALFVSIRSRPRPTVRSAKPVEVELVIEASSVAQQSEFQPSQASLRSEETPTKQAKSRIEQPHPNLAPSVSDRSKPAQPTWSQISPSRILSVGLGEAGEPPRRGPLREQGAIGRQLEQSLTESANAKPYLSERPPPILVLRSDGSLHYEGVGIEAVIGADGSVDFPTQDAVEYEFHLAPDALLERLVDQEKRRAWIEEVYGGQVLIDPKYSGRDERPIAVPVAGGTFDTCAIESRDCYVYEKQWFMKKTKKLRQQLHQRWRKRNLRTSLHELEVRIASVQLDDDLGSRQKRALFRKWLGECADNWEGQQAKVMLEDAILRLNHNEYARIPDAGLH